MFHTSFIKDIIAYRAVSRQQLGKQVPVATDTHATIEVFLKTTFSTRSVQRGYQEDNRSKKSSYGRESAFREDMCTEAEE
jgi:hypothetical protein